MSETSGSPMSVYPRMSSLLQWSSPLPSAAVFFPVFLFLVALHHNSLISVLAWSSLLALAGVVACRLYVYIMVHLLHKLPDQPR